jgi:hypothetical protein
MEARAMDTSADGAIAHESMGSITHSIWVKTQGRPKVPGEMDGDSLWVCVYSIYERNRGTTRATASSSFRVVGAVPGSPAADDYGFVLSN